MAVQKTNTNSWFIDLNQDLVLCGEIEDKEHRTAQEPSIHLQVKTTAVYLKVSVTCVIILNTGTSRQDNFLKLIFRC